MKRLFYILFFVLCSITSFAGGELYSQDWKNANLAYQQKQYDTAIAGYTRILQGQKQNAMVYYNLANAFYKNNQVSEAVLNYERALFYDAQLKEAKDNLQLAHNRIPNAIKDRPDIFFVRWWQSMTAGHHATQWSVFSLLLFLAFLGIIFWSVSGKGRNKPVPVQVYFFFPLFNLLLLFCAYTATKNANTCNKAVVMSSTTAMTPAPNVYKGQIIIPQATSVTMNSTNGNWVEVSLPDNRTGWVQRSELTFVQPVTKK